MFTARFGWMTSVRGPRVMQGSINTSASRIVAERSMSPLSPVMKRSKSWEYYWTGLRWRRSLSVGAWKNWKPPHATPSIGKLTAMMNNHPCISIISRAKAHAVVKYWFKHISPYLGPVYLFIRAAKIYCSGLIAIGKSLGGKMLPWFAHLGEGM